MTAQVNLPHNGRDLPAEPVEAPELPKLTPKQEAFVLAYTGEAKGNATEAARLAGYAGSDDTLRSMGAENLAKPHVAEAIRDVTRSVHSEAIATVEEVKAILTAIARDETLEPGPRIAAADKLLRSGGAYLERREVEHKGAASAVIYLPDNGRDLAPKG